MFFSFQTVRVEPYVTMGMLTRYLIPKGWTIPVVIELDDVTVGKKVVGSNTGRTYILLSGSHGCKIAYPEVMLVGQGTQIFMERCATHVPTFVWNDTLQNILCSLAYSIHHKTSWNGARHTYHEVGMILYKINLV